jgi:hypothetical protein
MRRGQYFGHGSASVCFFFAADKMDLVAIQVANIRAVNGDPAIHPGQFPDMAGRILRACFVFQKVPFLISDSNLVQAYRQKTPPALVVQSASGVWASPAQCEGWPGGRFKPAIRLSYPPVRWSSILLATSSHTDASSSISLFMTGSSVCSASCRSGCFVPKIVSPFRRVRGAHGRAAAAEEAVVIRVDSGFRPF